MARVLYAWELGAALGHAGRALLLANALAVRGHEIVLVIRELASARAMPGLQSYRLLQAPLARSARRASDGDQVSYADVLAAAGFRDAEGLAERVRAWQALYDELGPDLIVADHAPTALLACRGTTLKRALYGSGFFSPPRASPLPSIRPWRAVAVARLAERESQVLASVNRALQALASPRLERLCELYEVDADFLLNFPELEHFPERGPAQHWGPIYAAEVGDEPEWPAGDGARVFAYLQPRSPGFERAMRQLGRPGCRTLLFAPGLSNRAAKKLATDSLVISRAPFKMAAVARQAGIAVVHGGPNAAGALLAQGVPLILFPRTPEQMLLARRVRSLGAGLIANLSDPSLDLAALLGAAIRDRGLQDMAAQFAGRHSAHSPSAAADRIALEMERLLL